MGKEGQKYKEICRKDRPGDWAKLWERDNM